MLLDLLNGPIIDLFDVQLVVLLYLANVALEMIIRFLELLRELGVLGILLSFILRATGFLVGHELLKIFYNISVILLLYYGDYEYDCNDYDYNN